MAYAENEAQRATDDVAQPTGRALGHSGKPFDKPFHAAGLGVRFGVAEESGLDGCRWKVWHDETTIRPGRSVCDRAQLRHCLADSLCLA